MSRICLIFLFILMAVDGYGQQDHFVLIQADNNQPFYVRTGDQTLNSTAQGHLILSQLKDSVYRITIGFPKKLFPEEDFFFVIDKNDLAFKLKNQEGNGWVLINMQTQELEMPVRMDTSESKIRLEGVKKDDAFSRLMAALVSDTAVMYNSYVEIAAKDSSRTRKDSIAHKDSIAPKDSATAGIRDTSMRKPDSPGLKPGSPNYLAVRPDSSTRKPDSVRVSITLDSVVMVHSNPPPLPPRRSSVTPSARTAKTGLIQKISEQRTAAVLRLIYTDRAKGHKTDTIEVIIPIDTLSPAAADSQKNPPPVHAPGQAKSKPVVINSDCRNYASDEDADRLKGRLLATLGEDARIVTAKKVFKLKCFSTNQLKGIAEIFGSEETKYRFLETAYPFVSDDRFRELTALFTDPVYIAKFKTLTGAGGQ